MPDSRSLPRGTVAPLIGRRLIRPYLRPFPVWTKNAWHWTGPGPDDGEWHWGPGWYGVIEVDRGGDTTP